MSVLTKPAGPLNARNSFLLAFLLCCIVCCISCKKNRDITPNDPVKYREEILYTQTPPQGSGINYSLLVILNGKGDTLKTKKVESPYIANFQRWALGGQLRYTYFVTEDNLYNIQTIGYHPGYTVIANSALNELKRVYLLPHKDINADNSKGAIDFHDFILLSDNHYISLSYFAKQVKNIPAKLSPASNITVVAAIIQEVVNGQVTWQWDATDFPELYTSSVESNTYADASKPADYLHVNAMFIDPNDNDLIVSCRNTDQVLKISRKNGNIVWRLGGKNSDFVLPDNRKFLRQHNVTITDDNTLLLFDNGDADQRPYTRILEFKLNEISKDIIDFRSFNVPAPFSQFTGSVQKIGDHYFIGGGTADYIMEINAKTQEKIFEMKLAPGAGPYRAFKY